MSASREAVSSFRDEDLIDLFSRRLPDLLERRPDLEPTLSGAPWWSCWKSPSGWASLPEHDLFPESGNEPAPVIAVVEERFARRVMLLGFLVP